MIAYKMPGLSHFFVVDYLRRLFLTLYRELGIINCNYIEMLGFFNNSDTLASDRHCTDP